MKSAITLAILCCFFVASNGQFKRSTQNFWWQYTTTTKPTTRFFDRFSTLFNWGDIFSKFQTTTRSPYWLSTTTRPVPWWQSSTASRPQAMTTYDPQIVTIYPRSSTTGPYDPLMTTKYPQTTRYPSITTRYPQYSTSTFFMPTFPTMQTGAAKTTTGLPPPFNDNTAVPCGYNTYIEKEGGYNSGQGIVGGTDARLNEFPYQAKIMYNNGFICGGSIISNRHILTAAHCILSTTPSSFSVVLGDHNRNAADAGEQTYKISNVIVHPQNSQRTNQFDFAILTTSANITFDRKSIRAVCLPPSTTVLDSLVGQNGIITGWGKMTEGGAIATILQKGNVPILKQADCYKSYSSSSITNDMMCAGYMAGGIDSCQGDSGGPLVVLVNNRFTLYGVTSWGSGCARQNYPGVYARVASVIDWIKSSMA